MKEESLMMINKYLQDHQLIVGIVVIADPGTVPINSRYHHSPTNTNPGPEIFEQMLLTGIVVCLG